MVSDNLFSVKGIHTYLRESTDQGLNMIARNGIPNECPLLVPHQIKKPLWIEFGQLTIPRTPPPIQVTWIGSPIFDAVLMFLNKITAIVVVNRPWWVRNPFPFEQVTQWFCFILGNFTLGQRESAYKLKFRWNPSLIHCLAIMSTQDFTHLSYNLLEKTEL